MVEEKIKNILIFITTRYILAPIATFVVNTLVVYIVFIILNLFFIKCDYSSVIFRYNGSNIYAYYYYVFALLAGFFWVPYLVLSWIVYSFAKKKNFRVIFFYYTLIIIIVSFLFYFIPDWNSNCELTSNIEKRNSDIELRRSQEYEEANDIVGIDNCMTLVFASNWKVCMQNNLVTSDDLKKCEKQAIWQNYKDLPFYNKTAELGSQNTIRSYQDCIDVFNSKHN